MKLAPRNSENETTDLMMRNSATPEIKNAFFEMNDDLVLALVGSGNFVARNFVVRNFVVRNFVVLTREIRNKMYMGGPETIFSKPQLKVVNDSNNCTIIIIIKIINKTR